MIQGGLTIVIPWAGVEAVIDGKITEIRDSFVFAAVEAQRLAFTAAKID